MARSELLQAILRAQFELEYAEPEVKQRLEGGLRCAPRYRNVLAMSAMTIEFPAALKTQVTATARRLGLSPARFVREAVEARLRTPAPPEGRSLYDLSQDLCGSVAGGPRDLARNKGHLHGYGSWKR